MTKIIGGYEITYGNGVIQKKNLIFHSDYKHIIVPKENRFYELMKDKKSLTKEQIDETAAIKDDLYNMFGDEWFTDHSPLFKAINTGILSLPKSQGGDHKCKITKL